MNKQALVRFGVSFGKTIAVLAAILLVGSLKSYAVGTADADVTGAVDDLEATAAYIKPIGLSLLVVLMGVGILKKFWGKFVAR